MRARFTNQQPQVSIVTRDGVSYVFLCLNEELKTETYPDMGDGKTEESYYEYDYNEIVGPVDKLPIDDIREHPDQYINYAYNATDPSDANAYTDKKISELKAQIDADLAPIYKELVK